MAFNLLRRLVRHLDRVELNTDIALITHLTEFSKCFRARWDDNLAIPLVVVLIGSYNGRLSLWLLWRELNSVQSVVFGLRTRGWRRWYRGIPERGACLR